MTTLPNLTQDRVYRSLIRRASEGRSPDVDYRAVEIATEIGRSRRTAEHAISGLVSQGLLLKRAYGKVRVCLPRDLRGVDLSGQDLAGQDLVRANLSGANLQRANLQEADLTGAELFGTDLTEANLKGACLNKVRSCAANFSGANVTNATAYGGEFPLSIWHGATVDGFRIAHPLDHTDVWHGASFGSARTGRMVGLHNNHCVIGAKLYDVFKDDKAGTFVASWVMSQHPQVGCWQMGLEAIASHFPDQFVKWYQVWGDEYRAGELDGMAWFQINLELTLLVRRLAGESSDPVFEGLAEKAPSRRWRVYCEWNLLDNLRQGIQSVVPDRDELQSIGSYKPMDFVSDRTFLRPQDLPQLDPKKSRNLDRAISQMHVMSVDELASLMRKDH